MSDSILNGITRKAGALAVAGAIGWEQVHGHSTPHIDAEPQVPARGAVFDVALRATTAPPGPSTSTGFSLSAVTE